MQKIFKDYYKILELETSRVQIEDIKLAYRTVAKKYHPDLNVKDNLAEERIKDINEAYRVLSNPSTKRKYDKMWNANVYKKNKAFSESGRQAGSVFSDFFYMFFGNIEDREIKKRNTLPIKGENIETGIEIELTEAFYGMEKRISIKDERGKLKTLNVSIPEGIIDGEKIRLIGQGKKGQNTGKSGDLLIKVKIKDTKKYKLKGYDLYTDLKLTPWEAALGTRIEIKSIDEVTKIYIPAGIQTGEKIKIPGKGYKKRQGERGDLIAEIKINVPKQLTKEEREIYKKLKDISKFNPRKTTK